jgi:hypothetical protein
MKIAIWDILAVLMLFAMCVTGLVVVQILANPYSELNPFPPATLPAQIVIPSSTVTLRSMPPTWTPGGAVGVGLDRTLAPSSTPVPSSTGFIVASFTPSSTVTDTPTITPTVTQTRTITDTKVPTKTPNKTKTYAAQTAAADKKTQSAPMTQTAAANRTATKECKIILTQTPGASCP